MANNLSLVMTILNSGYTDKAMEVAKSVGARGGTIFNAVGSAGVNAEKLYGITINPEKDVIMILVSNEITNTLLKALYENVGPNSDAQGIAFALPVDETTNNLQKQYKNKP